MFVLDASVPLEWYLGQKKSQEARRIAERLRTDSAIVSQLWPLEIANVLSLAVRKGHMGRELQGAAFDELRQLFIDVDDLTSEFAWTETIRLSDRYDLTAHTTPHISNSPSVERSRSRLSTRS